LSNRKRWIFCPKRWIKQTKKFVTSKTLDIFKTFFCQIENAGYFPKKIFYFFCCKKQVKKNEKAKKQKIIIIYFTNIGPTAVKYPN